MSELETRVGAVERDLVRQGEQLNQVRAEVRVVGQSVDKVGANVDELLARDAKRPDALTGRTVAATLIAAGTIVSMLAAFVWWLIADSPAVRELDRRITRLDDPEMGRVPQIERKIDRALGAWETSVRRK